MALARAIVRDPAAFLMDEPLSNLDARLRLSMRGEIKRLCHRLGATTIYVTHDQAEALTMADLGRRHAPGRAAAAGAARRMLERPANRFVALFVGNPPMNVLQAEVSEQGIHVAGATAAARCRTASAMHAAAGITELGIRPEDIRLAESGRGPARSRARSMWSSRWATRPWSMCASASSA